MHTFCYSCEDPVPPSQHLYIFPPNIIPNIFPAVVLVNLPALQQALTVTENISSTESGTYCKRSLIRTETDFCPIHPPRPTPETIYHAALYVPPKPEARLMAFLVGFVETQDRHRTRSPRVTVAPSCMVVSLQLGPSRLASRCHGHRRLLVSLLSTRSPSWSSWWTSFITARGDRDSQPLPSLLLHSILPQHLGLRGYDE